MERLLSVLDTEKVSPTTTEIDRMNPLEIVQALNAEDVKEICIQWIPTQTA